MATKPSILALSGDPTCQPWAAQGWHLAHGPTPGGRIQVVNHQARHATDGAKRLPTLIRRLQKGEQSHYWYTCWRQFNASQASQ